MSLEELRSRIDELDRQLIDLMNERARVAVEIGREKAQLGVPVYVPGREREVLRKVASLNRGPLSTKSLEAVYREIMSGSFALEKPLRIAYLGPAGSFSHLAAVEKFGQSVEYEAVNRIAAVFAEVCAKNVDFGIVPIENSIGGGIVDTLDALADSDAKVYAEVTRAIRHHLLGRCPVGAISRVYSKPEVFTQCQRWLSETGLAEKTIATASTSEAAKKAAEDVSAAAIGSSLAAELFGLQVLRSNIEDNPSNRTRFYIIAAEGPPASGDDKTALMFTAADKPGALVDVLMAFRQEKVNMTFIESRPSKTGDWAYSFFVDVEGHINDPNVASALQAARDHCLRLKLFGSFPRGGAL